MKQEKMHPAIIALTCFAASQPSLNGKLLAELLRKFSRSSKSSSAEKRHLRILARAAQDIHAAKEKAMGEERELAEQEILSAAVQVDGDQKKPD